MKTGANIAAMKHHKVPTERLSYNNDNNRVAVKIDETTTPFHTGLM